MFPVQKIKANSHHNGKPWAYPPLPPNHTVALKKVSFSNATLNFANGDESSSSFNYFQNSNNSRVKRIVNKYDANEYDHESSDCESLCMNDVEFEEKLEKKFIDAEEQDVHVETTEGRMRGGCGGSCSCAGEEVAPQDQRCCKKLVMPQDCVEQIRPAEPPSRSQTPTGNSSCCPATGSRPTCVKPSRCNSPCRSEGPGCGGGGCCGTGCRGGCGKPGQICMPVRTCSGSTAFRDHSFVSRSHWSLAKSDTPQPVSARSNSRVQTACERSDTSVNEQSRVSKNVDYDDDCKQLSRTKSGCECLGGGLDCQRCGRKVYQAEMMIAAGSPYHTICFSCYCCRKPLEPLTYQENCGEIYCKQCLIRNFGPQGYGYGIGAGVLQTPI